MSCENFFRRSGLYCPVHGWLYRVLGNVSTSAAKKIGVGVRSSTTYICIQLEMWLFYILVDFFSNEIENLNFNFQIEIENQIMSKYVL